MWHFTDLWADEAEAVREYLKEEWMECVHYEKVDTRKKENLRKEANQIITVKISYILQCTGSMFKIIFSGGGTIGIVIPKDGAMVSTVIPLASGCFNVIKKMEK